MHVLAQPFGLTTHFSLLHAPSRGKRYNEMNSPSHHGWVLFKTKPEILILQQKGIKIDAKQSLSLTIEHFRDKNF